ncbi:MAG: hypothetical protein EBQ94_13725 [Flavobacteriales bacterium]|nr:hypothetical protein [Flavobacteriales bacterium]NCA22797.1 hypothetical protein [Crocinitomicaceae bacterium]
MGYFLQELNSKAKITNKGVPGYGLFQMYSSLKYDVIAGKKPLIAIFNYATFHDGRTPLVNAYSRDVTSVLHPNLEKNKKSYLKYLDFNEKKNIIKSIKITELPKHFMFRHYSALINLINTRIDENQYSKIQSKLNRISYLTVIEIKKFCEKNNIKLIFVGLDKDSKNLLNKLKIEGVHVVYFPIDISKPSNNCAPIDPFHPNAKVHKHYADLISMELKKIKLI